MKSHIPPDILSHIFLFTLPQHGFSLPQPESPRDVYDFTRILVPRVELQLHHRRLSQQASRTPLLFGTICRYWREIAYSTPMLWARLEVTMRDESLGRGLKVFEEWIARSSGCPLSIYIGFRTPTPAALQSLLDAISPHCHRLESLNVFAHTPILTRFAETILRCKGGLPLLRSLLFTAHLGKFGTPQASPFDVPHLPQLAQLSLRRGFNLNFADQIVQTNLRVLQLELQLTLSEVLNDLRLFPSVEELSIAFLDLHHLGEASGVDLEMITLPRLRKFQISSLADRTGHLLDRLSLPSLQHLVYGPVDTRHRHNGGEAFTNWSHLSVMLKRSNADLVSIRFADRLVLPHREVVACLQLSPNLRHLAAGYTFWKTKIVDELIGKGTLDDANSDTTDDEELITTNDPDPLVPLLEEFTFDGWPGRKASEKYPSRLAKLVSSRWSSGVGPGGDAPRARGGPRLVRATFVFEIGDGGDTECILNHPRFRELISGGLEVRFFEL